MAGVGLETSLSMARAQCIGENASASTPRPGRRQSGDEQSFRRQRHPFDQLTPDVVVDALEGRGLACDGRLQALSSYENRVYQVAPGRRRGRGGQVLPARALERDADPGRTRLCRRTAWRPRSRSWRRCCSRAPRCTSMPASSSPSARVAAGARPSWMTRKCWNGSAAFSRACTTSVPRGLLPAGRRWTCRPSARSPCTGCCSTR